MFSRIANNGRWLVESSSSSVTLHYNEAEVSVESSVVAEKKEGNRLPSSGSQFLVLSVFCWPGRLQTILFYCS